MARIRGITVKLYEETVTGYNPFGEPIIDEDPTIVENVLISEPSTDDIATSTNLYGKTISAMLAIPKGDTHNWKDKKVEWTDAYGITHTYMTFGDLITGIEGNIPPAIPWHMKVRVEAYE